MNNSVSAYPLQWPDGWERTKTKQPSRFSVSFGKVRDEIVKQLKLMGATNVVLSTNIPLKNDGLPYATYSSIQDTGVAVYFFYKKKQMVFACDKWNKVEDNLHAVNKTIEAIRGIERWGASEMLERAFTGFAQLSAPAGNSWWEILGVSKDSSKEEVKAAYRAKAKIYHEAGSSPNGEMMAKLNHAFDESGMN